MGPSPHAGDVVSTESPALTDSRLANLGARLIAEAYDDFENRFRIVTRRARVRFAERDWKGMAADARERLDLYERAARRTADSIRGLLENRTQDRMVWAGMKAVYSGLIMGRHDWELAETFFNSVTRRIFTTVGVDPRIEFVDSDYEAPPSDPVTPIHRTYPAMPIPELVRRILRTPGWEPTSSTSSGTPPAPARGSPSTCGRWGRCGSSTAAKWWTPSSTGARAPT